MGFAKTYNSLLKANGSQLIGGIAMSNKNYVIYPAVFEREDDVEYKDVYNVSFPDVPGCFTFGEGIDDAMYMAQDALGLMLYDEADLPKSSPIEDIKKTILIN
jgi:predicted RNase H-like HicB family nuclease